MARTFRQTLAFAAIAGLLTAGSALAEEQTNFDYTGLPVTESEISLEEAVTYTTIPTRLRIQECETIDNMDDYTGAGATRCSATEAPELEWDYLY